MTTPPLSNSAAAAKEQMQAGILSQATIGLKSGPHGGIPPAPRNNRISSLRTRRSFADQTPLLIAPQA